MPPSTSSLFAAVAKNASVVSIGTIAARGSVFLLYAAISQTMPIGAASGVVQLLSACAAYSIIIYFASSTYLARLELRDNGSLSHQLGGHLAISAYSVLASALLAPILYTNLDIASALRDAFVVPQLLIFVTLLSYASFDFVTGIQQGRGSFLGSLAGQLLFFFFHVVVSALLYLSPPSSPLLVLLAPLASGASALIWYMASRYKSFRTVRPDLSRETIRAIFSFSFPIVLAAIVVTPVTILVATNIPSLTSADRLAFLISLNWFGLAITVPTIVSNASLSILFRHNSDARKIAVPLIVMNACSALVVFLAILLSMPFVVPFYGTLGEMLGGPLPIVVLGAIPVACYQAFTNIYAAEGTMWKLAVGNISFAITLACLWLYATLSNVSLLGFCVLFTASHFVRAAIGYALLLYKGKRAYNAIQH